MKNVLTFWNLFQFSDDGDGIRMDFTVDLSNPTEVVFIYSGIGGAFALDFFKDQWDAWIRDVIVPTVLRHVNPFQRERLATEKITYRDSGSAQ